MYQIVRVERLEPAVKCSDISAPEVSRKAQADQLVIIRVIEEGERIPLTIAE